MTPRRPPASSRGIGAAGMAAILSLLAACSAAPRAVPVRGEYADAARAAYERARQNAYRPRRFKALFSGEIAPKVGAIGRGYLSCWWDGRTLVWRASAPLAGAGNAGRLSLEDTSRASVPFPGELGARDAVGVLLGVLDARPAGSVESVGEGFRIGLDDRGRTALLDERLRIVGLELPDGARVTYEPGDSIPRKIDARSREGSAKLVLQSFGDWPESEPIP